MLEIVICGDERADRDRLCPMLDLIPDKAREDDLTIL